LFATLFLPSASVDHADATIMPTPLADFYRGPEPHRQTTLRQSVATGDRRNASYNTEAAGSWWPTPQSGNMLIC
jgi:hypothetical protein